ncbi:MAG: hypothetical protein QM698_04555 [Micropepsaceae bacterium]
MTDATEALRRFRASMVLDFDAWKDGTPYDLAALDAMAATDRQQIAGEIIAKGQLDWRDVDALRRIGTPEALARIGAAAQAQSDHGGAAALRAVADAGWSAALETRFLETLDAARLMETSMDRLFAVAQAHPTPRVREKLLQLATEGASGVRYAFGAFLLYLHGHADEWYGLSGDVRPHLLALSSSGDERAAAQAWLRTKIAAPVRGGAP